MKLRIRHNRTTRQLEGGFLLTASHQDMQELHKQIGESLGYQTMGDVSVHVRTQEQKERSRIKNWEEES